MGNQPGSAPADAGPGIAAIDETGKVTWVSRSTTTVTATAGDQGFECIVRAKEVE